MRRKNEKASFDPERAHIRIEHRVMQTPAFKILSTNSVWLYNVVLAQYRGSYSSLTLPYGLVRWRLSFPAFKKAVIELETGGFLKVIKLGGLFKGPTIFSVPDPHHLFNSRDFKARCAALQDDETAGREVIVMRPNELTRKLQRTPEWYPYKRRSKGQQENIIKARAKLAEGRLSQKRLSRNKHTPTKGRKEKR